LRAAYGKNARATNCRLVPAFSSATPTFFYSSDPNPWVEVLFSVGGENIVRRFCVHRSLISRVLFKEVHRLPQSRPTRSFTSRAVFIPSIIDRACTTHPIHPFPYTTSKGEFIQYYIPCILLFVGVSWPRRRGGSSLPARQVLAQARPTLLSFPKPLSRTRHSISIHCR